MTIEDSLKALIARKDKVYVASHVVDVNHIMGLLLGRLGLLEMASEMLREVRNKKLESIGPDLPNVAEVYIDSSTLAMFRGDMKLCRAAFDDGRRRLQKEKLPLFHPYMAQACRYYDCFNNKATS